MVTLPPALTGRQAPVIARYYKALVEQLLYIVNHLWGRRCVLSLIPVVIPGEVIGIKIVSRLINKTL